MKPMRRSTKTFALALTMLWTTALAALAQSVRGVVVDAVTLDTLAHATLQYADQPTPFSADAQGRFSLPRREGHVLRVSSVGYRTERVRITSRTSSRDLIIRLTPSDTQLSEVSVKAKRKKGYKRKGNPAVELMRRVIAAKERTNLERHDFYQYDKYQKITMAINNITPEELQGSLFASSPWLLGQVEVSEYNNQFVLPISVDETASTHLYRRHPATTRDLVRGQTTRGISKLIQTGDVFNTMAKDIFCDIDLYDDQVTFLQKRFPSPIGSTAISFYHFYIEDTVAVAGDSCIRLQFMPANNQDFGFRGELYVLNDSSLHVRRCVMQMPHGTGVNFVQSIRFEQEFERLPNGDWALTTDNMVAELQLTSLIQRAMVVRTTRLDNYAFDPIDDRLFRGHTTTVYEPQAKTRDEAFWAENRRAPLTHGEANMEQFIQQMRQTSRFKWVMVGVKAVAENFVETASEGRSKIDIGPINTIISRNFVDGIRLRASARSTAQLSPHWFGEGYYAYGTKSGHHYYDGKLTYSFNKPKYQPNEFPVRTISLESTKDVESPSDRYLEHNKDNIFMSVKPQKAEQMYFFNRQALNFTWETDYGLASSLQLKTEADRPTGTLSFLALDGTPVSRIRTTEIMASLDYRPGQSYVNTKQHRIEVNLDAPQFTLRHTMGLQGFLGGQYRYNTTELKAYKRLWLASWGHFDMRLMAGAAWNRAPYFMLCLPAVNTSLFEHQGSFNLMEDMEFINDRYLQFNLAWDLAGKLFNRVPLLRRLKLREYVAFKGLWGHLTSKNNPTLPENRLRTDLWQLPEGSHIMTNEPYLELVVGIHNIFQMFEIDYVRRLTYTAYPGISKGGIRLGFNLVF